MHRPTISNRMVAGDLSLFTSPTSAKWAHCIDIMFNMSRFPSAVGHLASFARTSTRQRVSTEPIDNQGPALWLGKTHVVSKAVIDKM